MTHLPAIISDLALILILAAFVSILFKWLKQPVVLGYIVAGFIASPAFHLTPNVADAKNITTWADIGVIFLLFALGLDFSFKKLLKVGGTAFVATIFTIFCMSTSGYFIGQLMGWSHIDCIFLGGMLSMASTTIIIKAFNDFGLQRKHFANVVFGMLIVEDLAAILMMVLLSTMAVSQNVEGSELLGSVFKLVFFILIWFVVGIYLVPTMLKRFKHFLNDETLLIMSIGFCLGMVLFATSVGFSSALGAFIMGSILAETIEAERIERIFMPIKNFFGAIFFVSVGMMIVPAMLVEYAIPIGIISLVVIVGRTVFGTLGVLLAGEGLKVAVQAGASLGLIGEFSFIVASLGISLGVTSNFLYPIIVAISVITAFANPIFIKHSEPIYEFIARKLPASWVNRIENYSSGYKTVNRQSDWDRLIKETLQTVGLSFALSLAVLFVSINFIDPYLLRKVSGTPGVIVTTLVTLIPLIPFLYFMMNRRGLPMEYQSLWSDSRFNKGALFSVNLVRIFLALTVVVYVLLKVSHLHFLISVGGGLIIIFLVLYSERIQRHSLRIEKRFISNLNQRELHEERYQPVNKKLAATLLHKDLHLTKFIIPQNSVVVGKTLSELHFRKQHDVDVVTIIRGERWINIPDEKEQLFPYDEIVVVGTDEQLKIFGLILEQEVHNYITEKSIHHDLILSQFVIEADSEFIGKTIHTSKIREMVECMVIGIEREGAFLADFTHGYVFTEGDVVWLVGEKLKLATLGSKQTNKTNGR